MPFGLRNAPAIFQRFINDVLRPVLDICVFAYLDDIIIFSKSLNHHIEDVKRVLQLLMDNGLRCKLKKCEFHVTSQNSWVSQFQTKEFLPTTRKLKVLLLGRLQKVLKNSKASSDSQTIIDDLFTVLVKSANPYTNYCRRRILLYGVLNRIMPSQH